MRSLFLFMLIFLTPYISSGATLQDVKIVGKGTACSKLGEDLAEHLNFEFLELPSSHKAGNPYSGRIQLKKNFSLSSSTWDKENSFSSVRLAISTPYPHIYPTSADTNLVDFLYGDAADAIVKFTREINGNIGGVFDLQLSVTLMSLPDSDGNWDGYCTVIGSLGQKVSIQSNDIHLVPPLLRSLVVDQTSYQAGDQVVATLTLSSPLKNLATDHFEWVNPELPLTDHNRVFPKFESGVFMPIAQNADGSFTIKFNVPSNAKAGKYYLKFFNRSDVYDNFESTVGENDADELAISQGTPIVVK